MLYKENSYLAIYIYIRQNGPLQTPLIEDCNTLELFTLDLHCARIHREKWDIAVKNIEILILAA
jgi:hypothetical protein